MKIITADSSLPYKCLRDELNDKIVRNPRKSIEIYEVKSIYIFFKFYFFECKNSIQFA